MIAGHDNEIQRHYYMPAKLFDIEKIFRQKWSIILLTGFDLPADTSNRQMENCVHGCNHE